MSNNTFSSYFQQQALLDQLPFQIDFEISQVESETYEEVAGMQFSIVNDLVAREEWFFTAIETLNSSRVKESSAILLGLSTRLKETLNLSSLEEASNLLWEGSEDYKDNEDYIRFFADNSDKIQELIESMQLAQDSTALDWLRVTFFILSRVTSDWSLAKTVGLKSSEIANIIQLIIKEANGGIEPAPAEDELEGENLVEAEGKTV